MRFIIAQHVVHYIAVIKRGIVAGSVKMMGVWSIFAASALELVVREVSSIAVLNVKENVLRRKDNVMRMNIQIMGMDMVLDQIGKMTQKMAMVMTLIRKEQIRIVSLSRITVDSQVLWEYVL